VSRQRQTARNPQGKARKTATVVCVWERSLQWYFYKTQRRPLPQEQNFVIVPLHTILPNNQSGSTTAAAPWKKNARKMKQRLPFVSRQYYLLI
jgi:hypothetical protein